jgi:hypothetical protein
MEFYSFLEKVEQVLCRQQTYQNPVNLGQKFNLMCNKNDCLVLKGRPDAVLQKQCYCHIHEMVIAY